MERRTVPLGCHVPFVSRKKMKKRKVWKEYQINFRYFRLIFTNKVLFQMQKIFSAYRGDS